jgi:hypothetical protein
LIDRNDSYHCIDIFIGADGGKCGHAGYHSRPDFAVTATISPKTIGDSRMADQLSNETWIFVIVQDPGKNEHFFGLEDAETKVSYIPAFRSKEDAQDCLIHLPTQKRKKYEVQAVLYGDLTRDAFSNNFFVFMLDGDGKITDKIYPDSTDAPVH